MRQNPGKKKIYIDFSLIKRKNKYFLLKLLREELPYLEEGLQLALNQRILLWQFGDIKSELKIGIPSCNQSECLKSTSSLIWCYSKFFESRPARLNLLYNSEQDESSLEALEQSVKGYQGTFLLLIKFSKEVIGVVQTYEAENSGTEQEAGTDGFGANFANQQSKKSSKPGFKKLKIKKILSNEEFVVGGSFELDEFQNLKTHSKSQCFLLSEEILPLNRNQGVFVEREICSETKKSILKERERDTWVERDNLDRESTCDNFTLQGLGSVCQKSDYSTLRFGRSSNVIFF